MQYIPANITEKVTRSASTQWWIIKFVSFSIVAVYSNGLLFCYLFLKYTHMHILWNRNTFQKLELLLMFECPVSLPKIMILWHLISCNFGGELKCFGRTLTSYREGRWMQQVLTKCGWYLGKHLCFILFQKINFAAMRTSVITQFYSCLFVF
jgi:hypothetical protein